MKTLILLFPWVMAGMAIAVGSALLALGITFVVDEFISNGFKGGLSYVYKEFGKIYYMIICLVGLYRH